MSGMTSFSRIIVAHCSACEAYEDYDMPPQGIYKTDETNYSLAIEACHAVDDGRGGY